MSATTSRKRKSIWLFQSIATLALLLAVAPTTRAERPAPPAAAPAASAPAANAADSESPARPDVAVRFRVEATPAIMASLAKAYADSQFDKLWVARSLFENEGGKAVTDFRVRFRVDGYSSWSGWHRKSRVAPGEKVLSVFHPVLDYDKLASLTSLRPAGVTIEMRYTRPDGSLVQEVDFRRTKILSRNHVIYSSRPFSKDMSFQEQRDLSPLALASLVTSDDPVVQAIAGEVSNMLDGAPASSSDEAALKFTEALFNYMKMRKITYTSPTGQIVAGRVCQHIKYARDVLRNNSGTCVDLAVLYASVMESVGLQPILFQVPGHCFPGVKLPKSGKIVPFEATLLKADQSFVAAVKKGREHVKKWAGEEKCLATQTFLLHSSGIHPLDLPRIAPEQIAKLVKTKVQINRANHVVVNRPAPNNDNDGPTPIDDPRPENSIAGTYVFRNYINGVWVEASFQLGANGRYAGRVVIPGRAAAVETGRYAYANGRLASYPDDGEATVRQTYWKDGLFWVYYPELGMPIGFVRAG